MELLKALYEFPIIIVFIIHHSVKINDQSQLLPAINGGVYVGLKRRAPGVSTLEWVDGQALDTAALAPYWEANQPNGACCGQDCVVIRAFIDSTLNDVTCGTLQDFVCELLEP